MIEILKYLFNSLKALLIHGSDVTTLDTPMVSGGESFVQALKKLSREAENPARNTAGMFQY